ncbi:MAG: cysteine--tRNA ligase [Thaumarchaeota archaeon]|nr:cysteine--tRNA ligase [Candidatus Calditenuaceae archaeon]
MLRVYNSLTRKIEEFAPLRGNRVKMYVCGPTVYDYAHIGHARTYVSYDVMARYLRNAGYSLFYLMNITDVDDKIIQRAAERGVHPLELAKEFERYFMEDLRDLRIESVNLFARASEHIDEIIDLIKGLLEKGFAYETSTGVYFDTEAFGPYGELSGREPEELSVHRIEPDPTKRRPQDFALWKLRPETELGWDSPWGYGRPGWHIEDTAIIMTYFGPQLDVHGGAIELIFPHHEAERAQAEAASGVAPFSRYWIHTGLLTVEGEKMSKSLGNIISIREVLRRYSAEELRYFYASSHYRSPVEFSWENLEAASRALDGIESVAQEFRSRDVSSEELDDRGRGLLEHLRTGKSRFISALEDDFNTPLALSVLHDSLRFTARYLETNDSVPEEARAEGEAFFALVNSVLGVFSGGLEPSSQLLDEVLSLILNVRERLRSEKRYELADAIRSALDSLGIRVEDTAGGARWRSASRRVVRR